MAVSLCVEACLTVPATLEKVVSMAKATPSAPSGHTGMRQHEREG